MISLPPPSHLVAGVVLGLNVLVVLFAVLG